MTIIEYLQRAIEEGNELTIIYHGGSKPGNRRRIIPRSMDGDTLKAVDTEYNRVKSFSIRKMEILNAESEVIGLSESNESTKNSVTIEDLFQQCKSQLESIGWHVMFEERLNEKGSHLKFICLYDSHKNGNPRAKPSVFIYSSTSKHRPCGIGSPRMETRTYKSLNNAFKLFLEEALNCEITNTRK